MHSVTLLPESYSVSTDGLLDCPRSLLQFGVFLTFCFKSLSLGVLSPRLVRLTGRKSVVLFVIPKNGSMTEIERYDYTGRGTRLNLDRKIQLVLL